MELPLQDTFNSGYLAALSPSEEERHFPPGRGLARHADPKYKFGWSHSKYFNLSSRVDWEQRHPRRCSPCGLETTALGPHHLAALAANETMRGRRLAMSSFLHARARERSRRRLRVEESEGRELADSEVPLPGDEDRARRPPSLERQEAFRDAKTVKKGVRSYSLSPEREEYDVDPEVAELYRLGLLYDNEHERGSGFGFDSITHDEPLFAVNVRPARRARKRKALEEAFGCSGFEALDLQLSFTAFGDDDALARFLISPDRSELALEMTDFHAIADSDDGAAETLLTTIYELGSAEQAALEDEASSSRHVISLNPTYDGDTTQARALAPAAIDVPDLISDIDYDDEEEDNEWAILRDGDDGVDAEHAAATVEEVDGAAAVGSGITANPEAWIVLS